LSICDAKTFVPVFKEPGWRPVFKAGGVEVVAADERSMLAMKMRVGRGRPDELDIQFLLNLRLNPGDQLKQPF